jgi:hypothetical protein
VPELLERPTDVWACSGTVRRTIGSVLRARCFLYVLYALELLFDVFDCLLVGELVAYAALADVDRGLYAAVAAKRFEECSFSVVLGFDGTCPC